MIVPEIEHIKDDNKPVKIEFMLDTDKIVNSILDSLRKTFDPMAFSKINFHVPGVTSASTLAWLLIS